MSKIRNPVIARVFRELNLIEQWGSGVRRIFREADEQDLSVPQIQEIGMRLRFTVWLNELLEMSPRLKKDAEKIGVDATQSPIQSLDPVIKIAALLRNGPLSSRELRSVLNLKHRPTFRKNYLHPALEAGYIEMTIPDKPNSRLQKYRLTEKGLKAIE